MFNYITQAAPPKNMERSCRICLQVYKKMPYYSLFTQKLPESDIRLCDALQQLTSVKFCLNDGLPIKICASCESRVIDAYALKLQTERNTEKLMEFIENRGDGKFETEEKNNFTVQECVSYDCENQENLTEMLSKSNIKESPSSRITIISQDDKEIVCANDVTLSQTPAGSSSRLSKAQRGCTSNQKNGQTVCVRESLKRNLSEIEDFVEVSSAQRRKVHFPKDDREVYVSPKFEQTEWQGTSNQTEQCMISSSQVKQTRKAVVDSKLRQYKRESLRKRPNEMITPLQRPPSNQMASDGQKNPATQLLLNATVKNIKLQPQEEAEDTNLTEDDKMDVKNDYSYNNRKYTCNVCTKKFVGKSNLVEHLRLHANLKPFECKFCGKRFVQSGNYMVHLRTHTKERPYQCKLCPNNYTQSGALKVHIRSHTNERNYKCEECGKAFTNSSDLGKHARIHDDNNKFICEHCNRPFNQKSNMKKHIKIRHPDASV